MYHCTQAGLDFAIVNTEKLERFASIREEERALAEKLLFDTTDEILAEFTAFYRGKKKEEKKAQENLSLEERLHSYIVEGTKEGLIPDLQLALQKYATPLEVVNGPLMDGMDTVGKLFNNNELIVAEVLQSAEVMKASVQFLEQFMEKKDDSGKGKILLATVKGDVHDIGKNLVEIILSNNGFKVVNLGIKVTSNELIEAIKREKPDAIGLSGLLVKSAQQMVLTANDLREQKISIPVLVGGAALTRKFTETKIQAQYDGNVLYAKDAMNGLELANKLFNKQGAIKEVNKQKDVSGKIETLEEEKITERPVVQRRSTVSTTTPIHVPNDLTKHSYIDYKLTHIKPYINLQTLLGKHLGLKGKVDRLLKEGNEKAVDLKEKVDDLFNDIVKNQLIKAQGIYQFFPAQSEGDDIIIYDPKNGTEEIQRFTFPRQTKEPYLCLADFVRPISSGEIDYVGFFAVTAGVGVRQLANEWKEQGEYLKSHLLQATALELAEAFAEQLHHSMRNSWGIPDDPELKMQQRFSAKYQGMRVSFGYPACPDLADQKKLFELLNPQEIGITLTDEYMMDPEASVSAMVFAHPEARYFNVEE
ncbi:vitamin B12 dependent-methionine synthase activation domain-containing protein [Anaerobacillus arseniciselenatis]|uniref:vitamin B12 dependent-methionine synthase activation domain-containing protein n=1 Tax=Anaerobacillus arseniciselenatis TaxID=85682 RepID=UPI000A4B6F8E